MRLHEILDNTVDWDIPPQASQAVRGGWEVVVWVDVRKLDKAWSEDRGFYVGHNGENQINRRYHNVGEYIKAGLPLYMAEVSFDWKDTVTFINGRHRVAWLRDNGAIAIPIVVPIDYAKDFEKRFGTSLRTTTYES